LLDMTRRLAAVAGLAFALLATPAFASHHLAGSIVGEVTQFCGDRYCPIMGPIEHQAPARARRHHRGGTIARSAIRPALVSPAPAAIHRATVSRDCLTSDTRGILETAETHFGVRFELASTCRPGAFIAGTSDPSWHRFGRAVDLLVPRGVSKRAVVDWLYEHTRGVVMTYSNMPHVHFDTGNYHKLALGRDAFGGGRHHHQRHAAR
jgi:uncharacterized protein YcbK (DUF882 family)